MALLGSGGPGAKLPFPSPSNTLLVSCQWRPLTRTISGWPSPLRSPMLALEDVSETVSSGTISKAVTAAKHVSTNMTPADMTRTRRPVTSEFYSHWACMNDFQPHFPGGSETPFILV